MHGLRAITTRWGRSTTRLFGRAPSVRLSHTGQEKLFAVTSFGMGNKDDKLDSFQVSSTGVFPLTMAHDSNPNSPWSQLRLKSHGYWSALLAGLFGISGATLLYNSCFKDTLTNWLFPKAHCQGVDKCGESFCLRNEKQEEMIKNANAELEKALQDTKGKAVEFTEAALKAYCDANSVLKLFLSKVYCAVEEESLDSPYFEEIWCDVADAKVKRCEVAKVAAEKGECAWELLRRLREVVESGKACKLTYCNPLLVIAEQTLVCAEKEMYFQKELFEKLLKQSRTAEQYGNIIEEFRRDLKAEADSIIAGEECRVTLTDNEANMILTHAYKKILRVQKELRKDGSKC